MKCEHRVPLALMILGAWMAIDVWAQANFHHRAFTVTAVAPIVVTDLGSGGGFVVGTDGVARTCPDTKFVAEYLRPEGKGSQQLFFQYFDRKAVLISTPDHGYTLACLKVE